MIRVKLSTNSPDWPLIRQTPGRSGIWGNCQFFVNQAINECDFWVVYDDVLQPETTRCPPGNTLLITAEPPSVKRYPPRFLHQFARVLTCHRDIKHSNVIHSQQALPWMVGCRYVRERGQWDTPYTKDYDELSALSTVPKTKLLSVISSDKTFTPGHERRLAFVQALKKQLEDDIDIFGRGIRDVEDKWDAIAPYHYHIVIENGEFPDYWTEKLSDAIFAGACPLYAGCPNIDDYFSENTLTKLNLADFEGSLRVIANAMKTERFEATVQARQDAKMLLLNKYNLFPMLHEMAASLSQTESPQRMRIQPSSELSQTLIKSAKQAVRRWINP